MKIYVAAVEALRKEERHDETQFTTKIDGFLSFIPPWLLLYSFAGFLKISPCVWPNSGFWCCVFLTLQITLIGLFLYEDFWQMIFWLVLKLEISYTVIISWRILVSFRDFFEDYIFCMVKYLIFRNSSFAFRNFLM